MGKGREGGGGRGRGQSGHAPAGRGRGRGGRALWAARRTHLRRGSVLPWERGERIEHRREGPCVRRSARGSRRGGGRTAQRAGGRAPAQMLPVASRPASSSSAAAPAPKSAFSTPMRYAGSPKGKTWCTKTWPSSVMSGYLPDGPRRVEHCTARDVHTRSASDWGALLQSLQWRLDWLLRTQADAAPRASTQQRQSRRSHRRPQLAAA